MMNSDSISFYIIIIMEGKKGALEELSNEELIKILHQQLDTKEALKIELSSVQESSANLVPPALLTPVVQPCQG